MEVLKVKLEGDEEILIEAIEANRIGVARPAAGGQVVALDEIVNQFDRGLKLISKSGISLLKVLKEMETDEATLKISIGFSAEGNIILAKTTGDANFEVAFTWKKSKAL